MPIPNTAQFADLLRSFSLMKPFSGDSEKVVVFEESVGQYETGAHVKIPEISFWYSSTSSPVSLDALVKKMKSELIANKHLVSDNIVKSILLIYTGHPKKKNQPVESLNEILTLIQDVQVSQYFILPDIKGLLPGKISFGEFSIGNLNEPELMYKCQKAGSDYYERYKAGLHGRMAIERRSITVQAVNWQQLLYNHKSSIDAHSMFDRVLIYFEYLSSALFDEFWNQFNEQQNLQIALGVPDIYDKIFRQTLSSKPVSIYSQIQANGKRHGYVVPQNIGMLRISINFDLGSNLDSLKQRLETEYNFKGFDGSEIHNTIKTYVKFVAKAHRYLDDQKPDEGFVHFIIALELLLGDASASNKTVSERTAALVSAREGLVFEDIKTLVSKLYNARSKYVHEGQSIEGKFIEEVSKLCKTVLDCLLSYQKQAIKSQDSSFDKWKKQLDYIVSSLNAGEVVSDDFIVKVGIK